jgi:hypothetical protein
LESSRDESGYTVWNGTEPHEYYPPDVKDATIVEVVFRNGTVHRGQGQSFGWRHGGTHPEVHIVKYKVEYPSR